MLRRAAAAAREQRAEGIDAIGAGALDRDQRRAVLGDAFGRDLFARGLLDGLGGRMSALKTPVVPGMTATPAEAGYPPLGEANGLLAD